MPPEEEAADDDPLPHTRSHATSRNITTTPSILESPFYTVDRVAGHTPATDDSTLDDVDAITHETEPIQKASELSITIYDGLTGTRAAVLDDTGPTIPEIPVHLFFDIVLPQPPILDHVPAIFACLKRGKEPHYSGRERRWTAFPSDPATTKLHENEVYKQLEEIYRAILGATRGLGLTDEPTTTFTNSPHYVPKGVWRNSTSKPDGFFVLRNRRAGGTPHWMDIAATGEYKRDDTEKRNLEDVRDVLSPNPRLTFDIPIGLEEDPVEYAPNDARRPVPPADVRFHNREP